MAANKLEKRAKEWYNAQAELTELPWNDLKNKLRLAFRLNIDRLALFDEMQARRWKRSEKIEAYYYDKCRMLYKLNTPFEGMILHIIRGIDNTILRVQLKSQNFGTTIVSKCNEVLRGRTSVNEQQRARKRKTETPEGNKLQSSARPQQEVRCFHCNIYGHYSSACTKPKREIGSCFTYGKHGHAFRECSMVYKDRGAEVEVYWRIAKACTAYYSLGNVWRSSELSSSFKLRLFNSNVKSVLLYGCKTWKSTDNRN